MREKNKARKKKREALKNALKKRIGQLKPVPQPNKPPTQSKTPA